MLGFSWYTTETGVFNYITVEVLPGGSAAIEEFLDEDVTEEKGLRCHGFHNQTSLC